MPTYKVTDEEGNYERNIEADTAEEAALQWAERVHGDADMGSPEKMTAIVVSPDGETTKFSILGYQSWSFTATEEL